MSNHVVEEFASPHTENTLISIQTQSVLPEHFKNIYKVIDMSLILLPLHHLIINVNFHCMADLLSKHPSHRPLISGPSIFQAE